MGRGRHTQIARIAEALNKRGTKKIVPMTIWDMLLDPTTRGRIAFKSPAELDAFLEILHPMTRMLFLAHCLHAALDLALARKADVSSPTATGTNTGRRKWRTAALPRRCSVS